MTEHTQPLDWDIAYPLGVIAVHACAGRLDEAVAHARALIERSGVDSDGIESPILRQTYLAELHLFDRKRSKNVPYDDLEPLWVADEARRKPLLSHPHLYVYCLKQFIERMESRDE